MNGPDVLRLLTDEECSMLLSVYANGGHCCCPHKAGYVDAREFLDEKLWHLASDLRVYTYEELGCDDTPATREYYFDKLVGHLSRRWERWEALPS